MKIDADVVAHRIAVARTEEKKRMMAPMSCGHAQANLHSTRLGSSSRTPREWCEACRIQNHALSEQYLAMQAKVRKALVELFDLAGIDLRPREEE